MVVFLLWQVAWAKQATFVAVVETIGDESIISYEEKLFVTDRLREKANETLPGYMGYDIMTRENITAMLPPGKKIEECLGECLVETGRNISADYIAQARIGGFGGSLTISVELYETRGSKLVGSFTSRCYSADELLDAVDEKAPALFAKISEKNGVGPDGLSGFNSNSGYSYQGVKSFILKLYSDPSGAMVSIDGYPNTQCPSTPCSVQLKAGAHRISMVQDMYMPKDTTVVVRSGDEMELVLEPNFGVLEISPQMEKGFASQSDVNVSINGNSYDADGNSYEAGSIRLAPGSYSVELSHSCYESIRFIANIKKGKTYTASNKMNLAMGGLELSAFRGNSPVEEDFYVSGNYWGTTPYSGSVPVCGNITIGDERDHVPVTIRHRENVEYEYRWEEYEDEEEENSYYDGYNYSYSSSSSSSYWRSSYVRSSSSSKRSYYDDYDYGSYYSSSSSYSYNDDDDDSYSSSSSSGESLGFGLSFQFRIGGDVLFSTVSDDVREYKGYISNYYDKNEVLLGGIFLPELMLRIHLGPVALGVGGGYAMASTSVWQIGAICDENDYYCDQDDDEHSDELINVRNFSYWMFSGEFGLKTFTNAHDLMEFGLRVTMIPDKTWPMSLIGGYIKFVDVFDFEAGYFTGRNFASGFYMGMGISLPGFKP